MLNIKTFYNTAYRYNQNLYYQRVNDYHIFTNSQLVVAIKSGTNEKLYNELSEGITHRGNFNPTVMVGITEMFEKTYDTEESNIDSVYKADKITLLWDQMMVKLHGLQVAYLLVSQNAIRAEKSL